MTGLLSKNALREAARQKRSLLSPAEIEGKSTRICTALAGILDGMDPIMVYVSKPREVDTRRLIGQLIVSRKKIVVPVIEKETRTLRLSYLDRISDLVESTFQVPEPIGHELPADSRDIKGVIVPVLAFDRNGTRLGYGAGYYDRFLSAHPHMAKIGLAFACQEFDEIPADGNDIGMDIIITENGIIRCDCRYEDINYRPQLNTLK
ncbi:MAG: 5-formyltetrahydrofolate cyclo-ligase [Methanoregula sp.]|jgi:5-formyltetrahydrofolate cyclo-ligase|uniref:5-formyltetrahydrofolate cyclo-ligase n=1 Tax=Methanoregula sp. TaxID=2052170 RepID=UPI003D127A61